MRSKGTQSQSIARVAAPRFPEGGPRTIRANVNTAAAIIRASTILIVHVDCISAAVLQCGYECEPSNNQLANEYGQTNKHCTATSVSIALPAGGN